MSFYNSLHALYNGSGEPIVGPIEDSDETQVDEQDDFVERHRDDDQQARAEEERESIQQHMKELDRRYRYNEAVRAAQNVAIVGGALWMFGDG